MAKFRVGLVELGPVRTPQGIRGSLNVMDHTVPPNGAEVEIMVLLAGMLHHASSVDLALARPCSVDNGLLKLVVSVSPEDVLPPVDRNPALDVSQKL